MTFILKKLQYVVATGAMLSAVALGSLGISSCSNVLDIQPQLAVSYDQALSTTRGLDNALIGAYSVFVGGALTGGNLQLMSEVLADHASFNGTDAFGFGQIVNRQMEIVNTTGRSTWEDAYNAINRINLALDAMPTVTDNAIAANRDRIEGEGRFIRAYLHFEMARLYAAPWGSTADNSHPGVPYRTIGTTGPGNAFTQRAPLAEVYRLILNDLQIAVQKLPETNVLGRAHRWAARALMARVLFQQENYAQALTEADAVINSNRFQLQANILNVWQVGGTTEAIFETASQRDFIDAAGSLRGAFSIDFGGAVSGSEQLVALFATSRNDRRISAMYLQALGRAYTTRFDVLWSGNPLIRLSELFLIRAEAGHRTGRAVDLNRVDLNRSRVRAGLNPADVNTLSGDALLNAIITERSIELALEGHRLHELRRLRRTVANGTLPGAPVFQWNDVRLVMPRPDREISVNP